MPLSRHSVGTYQETSSGATCQKRLGHSRLSSLSHCRSGIKSEINVRELVSALKRREIIYADGEFMVEPCPKILANEEKATTGLTD